MALPPTGRLSTCLDERIFASVYSRVVAVSLARPLGYSLTVARLCPPGSHRSRAHVAMSMNSSR